MPKITFPANCNPLSLRLVGGNKKCDHNFSKEPKEDKKILSWKCLKCGTIAKVAKV